MVIAEPRIDPRVRRTRQHLQQAFLSLMAERAFLDITVQDITERADVNRGTFYAHFSSKYELMSSVLRGEMRKVLAQAMPADAPVTRANLHALTRTVCDYLAGVQDTRCNPNDHTHVQPLIEVAVQEELQAFVTAWLTHLPRPGSPPEIALSMAATVVSWAIFGAGMRWSKSQRDGSADEVAWQVVALLLKGMPAALGVSGRLT